MQVNASQVSRVANITDDPQAVTQIVSHIECVAIRAYGETRRIDGRVIVVVTRRICGSREPIDFDERGLDQSVWSVRGRGDGNDRARAKAKGPYLVFNTARCIEREGSVLLG